MKIALFITCLTEAHYPRAGVAVVRVLEYLGYEVVFPEEQTCCGQPMFNNGFRGEARALAERMIRVFEPYECVVTPSGSCAAMVCEQFPGLFGADESMRVRAESLAEKTFEFAQLLTDRLGTDLKVLEARWEGSATHHPSCHLRGIGATGCAQALLDQIEGVRCEPLEDANQCCGFGGTFSVKYPQVSSAMVGEKVDAIERTGAGTLVCSDAGCCMNIEGACHRRGVDVRVKSIAEIIAEGLGLLDREEQA